MTPDTRVAPGPLPTPAAGVQLLGEMEGSGYRRPPAIVRRADGQTITLTPLLYLTLKALDGRRGYGDVAALLSRATGRLVAPDDVSYLVEKKLRPLGVLAEADGSQPTTVKSNPLLALRLKIVITNRDLTRRLTSPFAWLFRPTLVVAFVAVFLAVTWFVLIDKGLASAVHQAFYDPGMIVTLWGLVIASAAFHEFGHAAACRYGGATPGAMGAGLYLIWPAFYTDVTDSYSLGRAGRLRVDLGGLYFNAIFAVATMAAWLLMRSDALLLIIVAQHLQMLRQLAPFIRADGYHIVADLTGVPDLFAHIKPTLRSLLPKRWRPAHPPQLKRWARAVVALWVFTMVPALLALLALAVVLLPRLAATAWDSMNIQWEAVEHYWSQGDLLGVGVRALSAVIVLLPVLGLLYLLARIVRRTATRVWAATEGNRAGRAAAVLGGVALASAVAYAWLPGDSYRPIEGDEGGTLTDLVRVEDGRVFLPLLQGDAQVLRAAPTAVGQAAPSGRVAEALPSLALATTGRDDASAVMLTGSSSRDVLELQAGLLGRLLVEKTWPFPFPPPEDPDPGDNRAWAVNTVDDSLITDLAVSWALVTANEVTQRNEAWALASCEDCRTIAVAFQVLLLLADSEVVAPENVAAAANYECTRCRTEAVAVQLVVSLTGMPSDEAMQQIAVAMGRVAALEEQLGTMSAVDIYLLLNATQEEIVAILTADGKIASLDTAGELIQGTTAPTPSSSTGSGPTSSTQTAAPSAGTSGTPEATESTSPTTTTSTGSTSTAEPTAEPTTAPTTSPTSEPATEPSGTSSSEPTSDPSPTSEPTASTAP